MTNIDFAALPDAEAARLMAERDGWRVVKSESGLWSIYGPKFQVHGYTDQDYAWWTVLQHTKYLYSLDAAVGWLERMGLELAMLKQGEEYPWLARCEGQPINHAGPTAARALCNAGWAAVQARWAANG